MSHAEESKPVCPRCKREIHPWPLERGAICSPKGWAHCIRNDTIRKATP